MNLFDVKCFKLNIYKDSRGVFVEEFNKKKFKKIIGREFDVLQQNMSISKKGVIRGLHYQTNYPQAKIINVLEGKIFDVVVDLRKKSKSFGTWKSFLLSSFNKKYLYIPEGFAHGFLALEDKTKIKYITNNLWNKKSERTILWNDPNLKINWPLNNFKIYVSKKDKAGSFFKNVKYF